MTARPPLIAALLLALATLSPLAIAGPTACPQHYLKEEAPGFAHAKLATRT